MPWLNYHHLLYFWTVAREGGLVAAGKVLHVSHPTLSAQIHTLESQLGEKLFMKTGRKLELTEMGRIVFRYAEEIFSLGREMLDTVRGRATGQSLRLNVGIVDAVPKFVVRRLMQPALQMHEQVRVVCRENSYANLLAELSTHALDIVISDAPIPAGSAIKAFHHLLGETPVSFFAAPGLTKLFKSKFPQSLQNAPLLLPMEGLPLRRQLNQWFDEQRIRPRIVGEFEDSALMKVFGGDGIGIFVAPTVIESEIKTHHRVNVLGRVRRIRERYYAISIERRLKNPAAAAISEAARSAFSFRRTKN